MKHIIFFFALIFAATLTAQDTVESDTSYIQNRSGVFYNVLRTTYQTGRIVTEETPIGSDTATVANFLIGSIYPELSAFAAKAVEVARFSRQVGKVNNASQSLQSLLGLKYYDVLEDLLITEFLPDSVQTVAYTMRVGVNAPVNVTLRKNASGSLVMRQGSTNFSVDIVTREWIRIRRYDGSATQTPDTSVRVDLFRETPNRWVSRDLNFIFIKQ